MCRNKKKVCYICSRNVSRNCFAMAYEYFISYRRKSGGENQARQVAEILSKYVGEDKVFYDRVSMREGNWRDQINDALNSAEHFVLLVNEASAAEDQSNNIGGYRYEIEYALKNGKKISLIEYDKKSYDEVIKKYPSLKDAQKVTFNGEYNFAFEERLCKHFGFDYKAENSAPTIINNTYTNTGSGKQVNLPDNKGNITISL